mgnify:CR=1 FL=1
MQGMVVAPSKQNTMSHKKNDLPLRQFIGDSCQLKTQEFEFDLQIDVDNRHLGRKIR